MANDFKTCLQILTPQVYAINLGSMAMYRNYAQSFLGRPARNQAELDAMCYTFAFIEAIIIQTGYGTKTNIRAVTPTELDPTSPFTSSPFGLGKFKIDSTLAQSRGQLQKINVRIQFM